MGKKHLMSIHISPHAPNERKQNYVITNEADDYDDDDNDDDDDYDDK